MRRTTLLAPLAVLLLLPVPALCEERNRLADALALQEAVHRTIERAEPSIACILVSRSEKYRAYSPVAPREPGRLGGFDFPRVGQRFPDDNDPEYQTLRRLDLSNPDNVPESYGSGIVIDEKEGLVLTLAHVVRNATKIYVRLPPDQRDAGATSRGSWADIHAADPRSDLAVLRLIERVPNLQALKLSEDSKLRKGDFVLSLSNPFAAGFRDGSPSASWGIVSNLRRRATGVLTDVPTKERNSRLPLYCFNTLIQTDTRMNLGCSGGALLNLKGELVGLTSSLAGIAGGETPGGFAVPIDDGMRRIIQVLLSGQEVEYGFLGVYLMRPDQTPQGSVRISGLIPGGPALRAEIHGVPFHDFPFRGRFGEERGDYILRINGRPIHSNDDLFLAVALQLAGNTVRIEVSERPDGTPRLCSVTLAKFPTFGSVIASKQPKPRRGLRVDWTSTVRLHDRRGIPEGVVIREVLPHSPAADAKLQPDMIIKSVNQKKVSNPAEFYREMDKANGSIDLTLGTRDRSGENRVTIKVK